MRYVVVLAITAAVMSLTIPAAFAAPRADAGAPLAQAGPGFQGPGPYNGPGVQGPGPQRAPRDWRMNRFRGFAARHRFAGVLPLLVIVGSIGLGFYAVSRLTPARVVKPAPDQALTILRERYAKGEITAEDYEAIKRTLG